MWIQILCNNVDIHFFTYQKDLYYMTCCLSSAQSLDIQVQYHINCRTIFVVSDETLFSIYQFASDETLLSAFYLVSDETLLQASSDCLSSITRNTALGQFSLSIQYQTKNQTLSFQTVCLVSDERLYCQPVQTVLVSD